MKIKYIILAAAVSFSLTSCSLYKKYESKASVPDDVFGTVAPEVGSSNNLAELSWREFFTDPVLQELIDSVLVRNTDLKSAFGLSAITRFYALRHPLQLRFRNAQQDL